MTDPRIQEWRRGIGALISLMFIAAFIMTGCFALIAIGQWILIDTSGGTVLRGVLVWFGSFVVLNLWSTVLRKLN